MVSKVIPLESIQEEALGDLTRRVVVTPPRTGNRNLRVVYVTGKPGGKGKVHTHPGEEVMFTTSGHGRHHGGRTAAHPPAQHGVCRPAANGAPAGGPGRDAVGGCMLFL